MPQVPFALQLYSVRDHLDRSIGAALDGVKRAGYDYVELAGTHGLAARDFQAQLREHGLKAVAAHIPAPRVIERPDAVIEEAAVFGIRFVVVPWLGGEGFDSVHAWKEAAGHLALAGARLREAGLRLCYHNHDHEFQRLSERSIFEQLCSAMPAEDVAIELDVCWASAGGADPVALLQRLGTRVPLVHIKDYRRTKDGAELVELGKGLIDWRPIADAAAAAGVEWYIVEQDESRGDSIESATANAAFMRRWNNW